MKKEEWQNKHDLLNEVYSEFNTNYHNYEYGKNKKIRDTGYAKSESAIHLADSYIQNNSELFDLLTDNESPFFYSEFLKPHYFHNDMGIFLNKIREKIKNIKE